jgi:hypothetical protein
MEPLQHHQPYHHQRRVNRVPASFASRCLALIEKPRGQQFPECFPESRNREFIYNRRERECPSCLDPGYTQSPGICHRLSTTITFRYQNYVVLGYQPAARCHLAPQVARVSRKLCGIRLPTRCRLSIGPTEMLRALLQAGTERVVPMDSMV